MIKNYFNVKFVLFKNIKLRQAFIKDQDSISLTSVAKLAKVAKKSVNRVNFYPVINFSLNI